MRRLLDLCSMISLFDGYNKDGGHSWTYFFNGAGYSDVGYCVVASKSDVICPCQ